MIRTQIYIPDDIHGTLLRMAQRNNTTLSELIRMGAKEVIKKKYGTITPQKKALQFFSRPAKKYRIPLRHPAHILVRKERD